MSLKNIQRFFWENKEGMIVGAIAGYLVYQFALPADFNFSMVTSTFGLIDTLSSVATSTIELAKTKVMWAFIIIGAGIGTAIDMSLKEGWYKKWL